MILDNENKLETQINDVIVTYSRLYHNIELILHDEFKWKSIDEWECVDIIISYSIAVEGSNILWDKILEKVIPGIEEMKFTIHDLELIAYYFPIGVWTHPDNEHHKNEFYNLIAEQVDNVFETID